MTECVSGCNGVGCVIAIGANQSHAPVPCKIEHFTVAASPCMAFLEPDVHMSRTVEVGEGTIICAGSILTVNIVIGRSVHINLDCTVGHDVVIEDFATIAPGTHISGNVTIKRGAHIGTGANIINGTPDRPLVIGEGAVVGAGACVIRDVPAFTTVVGVPARPKSMQAVA